MHFILGLLNFFVACFSKKKYVPTLSEYIREINNSLQHLNLYNLKLVFSSIYLTMVLLSLSKCGRVQSI